MYNGKERILRTIAHREPDRVPIDIGGTIVTGLRHTFYRRMLEAWGWSREIRLIDHVQRLVALEENVLERLLVDTRGFLPKVARSNPHIYENNGWFTFTDEWGIGWKMSRVENLYFSAMDNPLAKAETVEDIEKYPWPEPDAKLLEDCLKSMSVAHNEKFVIIESYGSGIFETALRMRGYEQFLIDLALSPKIAEAVLEKILETKMKYIDVLRSNADGVFHCLREGDDLATQQGLIVSRDTYRKFLMPRHKRLFEYVKKGFTQPPFVFFHSCGAVYPLIPDFIEAGIDILNPLQFSATGMDTLTLKKTFGQSITFWGGGIDTQGTLPRGSVEQVREEVKRQIDILAAGGGFVFAAVHNVQDDVPVENFFAMWKAWHDYSCYSM